MVQSRAQFGEGSAMSSLVLDQPQRESGVGMHADAAMPHIHHNDEIEHICVEALTGVQVGHSEGDVRDAGEGDHGSS